MTSSVARALWRAYNLLVCAVAFVWRSLVFRGRLIAISGSVGKTTTTNCLAAILGHRFPTVATLRGSNGRRGIPRTVLRSRPWHRFLIVEVGIQKVGIMWRSAWLLRPDMVILLNVARTHPSGLPTLEVVAAEKARLLGRLSRKQLAVLNADDPRVTAMATGRFGVSRFGLTPGCDVWADEISATWPERLSFRVHAGGRSQRVETRLVGAHWTTSVLAAIAAALQCGVSLEEAACALREVEPEPGRMQPVALPCGATMLRDEYNGVPHTAMAALCVLDQARARRKLIVFSCEYEGADTSPEDVAEMARGMGRVADVALILGTHAQLACRIAVEAGMDPAKVHRAESLPEAARMLQQLLKPGDLVLLRGTWDWHVSRVYFAQLGEITCWSTDCRKTTTCDSCPELGLQLSELSVQMKAVGRP